MRARTRGGIGREPLIVLGVFLVVAVVAFTLLGGFRKDAAPDSGVSDARTHLPFKDRSGKELHIADFRGKAVIVHFWASWCGPCRQEFPDIARYYEEEVRGNDKVVFLAISLDENGFPAMDRFLETTPVPFPVYWDHTFALSEAFRVSSIPSTFLIAPDGTVEDSLGFSDWSSSSLRRKIRDLSQRRG